MISDSSTLFRIRNLSGQSSLFRGSYLQMSYSLAIIGNIAVTAQKFIFVQISNLFKFKDRPSKGLRSNVVYKFLCGNCNATAYLNYILPIVPHKTDRTTLPASHPVQGC